MLFGIDPLLTPQLLYILAEMGHGDEIVIADANFPSASCARQLVQLTGCDAPSALRAITALMPLDTLVETPAITMQVVDQREVTPPVVAIFAQILADLSAIPVQPKAMERLAFYDRARTAFAIVRTGETRHYGNIILKKGVVAPPLDFIPAQ